MADFLSTIRNITSEIFRNAPQLAANPAVGLGRVASNVIQSQFQPQVQRVQQVEKNPLEQYVQNRVNYYRENPIQQVFRPSQFRPDPNYGGLPTPIGKTLTNLMPQNNPVGRFIAGVDQNGNMGDFPLPPAFGTYGALERGLGFAGSQMLARTPVVNSAINNLGQLGFAKIPTLKLPSLVNEGKQILSSLPKEMRLQHSLNYGNELIKRGFQRNQLDNISAEQAATIIRNNIKPQEISFPFKLKSSAGTFYNQQAIDEAQTIAALQEYNTGGIKGGINRILYPIKNLTEDIQMALQQHQSARNTAKVSANQVAQQFKSKLSPSLEWKLVQWSQNPTLKTAEKLKLSERDLEKGMEVVSNSRRFNDAIFTRARQLGIDLNYLENHIYQIFKESPEKIDNIVAAKGLGSKPGFANRRTIESFQQGMEYGLTPKFTTFAQLNAAMQEALDKAIANQKLVESLKTSGQLLPEGQAPASWEPITARFMPKENINFGNGQSIQQSYFAPPDLARTLNSYLGGQAMGPVDSALAAGAKLSSSLQDIVLSGGVRKVNFFTFAQAYKDTVTGLGQTLMGHPIRGAKLATDSWVNIFRGFIKGNTQRFEAKHAASIKEMAENGLQYSGVNSYENFAPNVADKLVVKGGNKLKNLWNSYANNPTFKEFMYQRRVSMFENLKSSFLRHGKSENEAIKLAVENIKAYDGVMNDLGRNKQVNDFFSTIFLAPKYRESVLGSLSNAVIKTLKFNDPSGSLSRGLGIGMLVSYLGYNALQMKLTGKPLWENPAGKEFELVIPDGKDKLKYYSVPWMPGFTAVPRRIFGTGAALYKGDLPEAGKQFSSLFSIPISKGGELLSNRDYFGRELIDTKEPITSQIPPLIGKMFGPGIVREGINYLEAQSKYQKRLDEGKSATPPNPWISGARILELPIKEGKLSSQFYTFEDKALKGLPDDKKAIYTQIYENDETKFTQAEKLRNNLLEAQLKLANPEVLEARKQIELETAKATGQAANPFWSLTPEQQKTVLTIASIPPGEQSKSDLQAQNIEWLKQYWTANSAFYDELKQKGVISNDTRDPDEYFQISPGMRNLLDQYYALPYGTGQRSAMIRQHPELVDYWNEKREFTNGQRSLLGLPPLADKFAGFTPYQKKPRKVAVKKTSPVRAGKIRLSSRSGKSSVIKIAKTPTIKITKSRAVRQYKPLKIKITHSKPKTLRDVTSRLFA